MITSISLLQLLALDMHALSLQKNDKSHFCGSLCAVARHLITTDFLIKIYPESRKPTWLVNSFTTRIWRLNISFLFPQNTN